MSVSKKTVLERLIFLTRIVKSEITHLQSTDRRLFAKPLTLENIAQFKTDEILAERVDAFVSRFGRLQDTLGDKLLPHLLLYLGERNAAMIDNLDKAERFGWIKSSDLWLEIRQLRNQMVHEYIEDPIVLMNALNTGHQFVAELVNVANQFLNEIDARMNKRA